MDGTCDQMRDFVVRLGAIDVQASSLQEAVKIAAGVVGTDQAGGTWAWFVKEVKGDADSSAYADWEKEGWEMIETTGEDETG
jgi:hypothetical protein